MRTKVKILSVFCSVVFIAVCLAGCSDYLLNEPAENANDDSGYTEYTNQIYYVGKDIDAGQYLLCCTGTNSSMDVVLFSDEKDHQAFREADPYTSGEFSTAFSQYGFVNFYMQQDEQVYISLQEGNVVYVGNGACTLEKYDLQNGQTFYTGIYKVGEDIAPANFKIQCLSDGMQITVFHDLDAYLKYQRAERFTVGEESEAIESFSDSTSYIYEGDNVSVHLQSGMVLMIREGSGTYVAA